MKIRLAMACLSVFGFVSMAHAADVHQMGTNLLSDCKAGNQVCYAYLLGVYDGAGITGEVAKHPLICPKGAINGDTLRSVYVKWATANPKLAASDERGTAAMIAMANTYPCH